MPSTVFRRMLEDGATVSEGRREMRSNIYLLLDI
jgi:hypothetical protein